MTDRLTEKEIEEIWERAEAMPDNLVAVEDEWNGWCVGNHDSPLGWGTFLEGTGENFAKFVVHARTDIPRLLDEVERLREERDRYRRDIKSALERIDTPRLLEEARDHDVQMAANKMRRMLNE